jgi:integrase
MSCPFPVLIEGITMATFRKRADKWQARVQRTGCANITKTFNNKTDASAWARHVETEIDKGTFNNHFKSSKITLEELLHKYLTDITPSKKGSVNETYRINTWLKHPLAKRFITDIKSNDFAEWRDIRLKQGVSPNTIRLDLAVIAHLYSVAKFEWGIETIVNPIQLIKMPKPPNGRTRRLETFEINKLLNALECTHEVKAIFQLAIETGMRRSELLNIKWNNVDLTSRVIELEDSKNGDARTIPLSSKAILILSEITKSSSVFIFTTKPHSVSQAFHRACVRSNLQNLKFHDLRHEATSRLFEKGLNTMEVSSITGHKTLSMLKRYTHLKASDLALKLG